MQLDIDPDGRALQVSRGVGPAGLATAAGGFGRGGLGVTAAGGRAAGVVTVAAGGVAVDEVPLADVLEDAVAAVTLQPQYVFNPILILC